MPVSMTMADVFPMCVSGFGENNEKEPGQADAGAAFRRGQTRDSVRGRQEVLAGSHFDRSAERMIASEPANDYFRQ